MENGENKNIDSARETEAQKAYAEELRKAGIISQEAPPDPGLEMMPPPEKKLSEPAQGPAEELSKEEIKIRADVAALKRMAEEHEKGSRDAVGETISSETQTTAQTEVEKEPKAQELEKEKTLRERISDLRIEVKAMVPGTEDAKKKQEELKTLIVESKDHAHEFLSSADVTKEKPRKLAESFRELTEKENEEPRNLAWEINKMAEKRLETDGLKIIKGPEAIKEHRDKLVKKEEIEIQKGQRDKAISVCWARLSEKEKAKLQSTESPAFKDYIKGHAQRLGVAEDIFYSLVGAGIVPEKTKKGWLGGYKIMDSHFPGLKSVSTEEFNRVTAEIQNAQFEGVAKLAEARADSIITEGKKLLRVTKRMCTENIIQQAVSGYSIEKIEKQLEEVRALLAAKENEAKNRQGKKRGVGASGPKEKSGREKNGRGKPSTPTRRRRVEVTRVPHTDIIKSNNSNRRNGRSKMLPSK